MDDTLKRPENSTGQYKITNTKIGKEEIGIESKRRNFNNLYNAETDENKEHLL